LSVLLAVRPPFAPSSPTNLPRGWWSRWWLRRRWAAVCRTRPRPLTPPPNKHVHNPASRSM
jgi:hypothetical protein